MHAGDRYLAVDTLKDGTSVTIRTVGARDKAMIQAVFRGLERETLHARFFAERDPLSDAELERMVAMNTAREKLLVATTSRDDRQIVIGCGSYHAYDLADGGRSAEVAFVVEEDYQRLGVATRLLAHLARIAARHRVDRLEAEVMAGNGAMLQVFDRSPFPTWRRRDGGVVHVSMMLPV